MNRPKIGLALGAGGARGLAHIGVLKVLQEEKIPIDFLAGSSMGSFIAVCYANGLDLSLMEGLSVHLRRKSWLDFRLPGLGFISGEKVRGLLELLTHGKKLEDLSIPTQVVATNLVTGERVIFHEGSAAEAVRASISIPGIFEPVLKDGMVLVDGAVVDRVPVSVVREMGAELVIGVDVFARVEQVKINNIFDVISQTLDIMERELLSRTSLHADLTVCPRVSEISPITFTKINECIQFGEEAMREKIPELKKMIEQWRGVEVVEDK